MARDLHDTVAHQIAVMNLNTAVASNALPDRPQDAEQALVTVREAGRAVIASIGDLLRGLREENWDDLDDRHSIEDVQHLVDEFRTLMPTLKYELSGEACGTARTVSAATYLSLREGLTNAYKHGRHDAPVYLQLRLGKAGDLMQLTNEVGSTVGAAVSPASDGFGVQGMRERVAQAGGLMHVDRADGTFHISVAVPAGEPRSVEGQRSGSTRPGDVMHERRASPSRGARDDRVAGA